MGVGVVINAAVTVGLTTQLVKHMHYFKTCTYPITNQRKYYKNNGSPEMKHLVYKTNEFFFMC